MFGDWWFAHVSFWMGDWSGYPVPNLVGMVVVMALAVYALRMIES